MSYACFYIPKTTVQERNHPMKKFCLALVFLLLFSVSARALVTRDDAMKPLPDASDPAAPQPFSDPTPQDKLDIWFGRVGV